MPNTNHKHDRYRRFVNAVKRVLSLALLLLEIVKRIKDLL